MVNNPIKIPLYIPPGSGIGGGTLDYHGSLMSLQLRAPGHLLSQKSLLWLGISIGQQQDRQGILVAKKRRAVCVRCGVGFS